MPLPILAQRAAEKMALRKNNLTPVNQYGGEKPPPSLTPGMTAQGQTTNPQKPADSAAPSPNMQGLATGTGGSKADAAASLSAATKGGLFTPTQSLSQPTGQTLLGSGGPGGQMRDIPQGGVQSPGRANVGGAVQGGLMGGSGSPGRGDSGSASSTGPAPAEDLAAGGATQQFYDQMAATQAALHSKGATPDSTGFGEQGLDTGDKRPGDPFTAEKGEAANAAAAQAKAEEDAAAAQARADAAQYDRGQSAAEGSFEDPAQKFLFGEYTRDGGMSAETRKAEEAAALAAWAKNKEAANRIAGSIGGESAQQVMANAANQFGYGQALGDISKEEFNNRMQQLNAAGGLASENAARQERIDQTFTKASASLQKAGYTLTADGRLVDANGETVSSEELLAENPQAFRDYQQFLYETQAKAADTNELPEDTADKRYEDNYNAAIEEGYTEEQAKKIGELYRDGKGKEADALKKTYKIENETKGMTDAAKAKEVMDKSVAQAKIAGEKDPIKKARMINEYYNKYGEMP